MAWNEYWREHLDGIEAVEERSGLTWAETLALILAAEQLLKNNIVRRAAHLPLTAAGFFDTRYRRAWIGFRAGVEDDIATTVASLRGKLGGLPPMGEALPRTLPEAGVGPRAMAETLGDVEKAIDRAERIRLRDEAAAAESKRAEAAASAATAAAAAAEAAANAAPRGPELQTGTDQAAVDPFATPPEAAGPPDVVQAKRRRDRAKEDLGDSVRDQLRNIIRDLCDELNRVAEETDRMSGRFATLDDLLDYVQGRPGTGNAEGFRLDRNRARLSVVAHMRGLHRRRVIAEGVASGVGLYRLDVPKDRLGKVAPQGIVGPHLWRVRTLDEWRDIAARQNNTRVRSSAFDTLGLGFGDVSYVVPVPALYRADAAATGAALRARWLAETQRSAA